MVTPASTHVSDMTGLTTLGSGETQDVTPVQTKRGDVVSPMPFTLIQTLAIFFGAVFVVSVLILRMQKGGGGS